MLDNNQSHNEEIASTITHALGIFLSVTALVVLVYGAWKINNPWRLVSMSIYGGSLVVLYTASTIYHAVRSAKLKKLFNLLDNASIYILIAGTYTPVLLEVKGSWGWSLFITVWILAIAGLVFKIIVSHRYRLLSTFTYIGMGWLFVIGYKPLVSALPSGFFSWILIGGIAYTGGVAFYLWERLRYNHALWHTFVLAGSFLHFWGIYRYFST